MTQSRHTPAPWRVESDGDWYGTYRLQPFAYRHETGAAGPEDDALWEEDEANRQLMETAPDLLEALERAVALMRRVAEGDHPALEGLRDAAEQGEAAIAWATAV